MRKLELACGATKSKGYLGIDRLDLPGVDIVHDLDVLPYPFEEGTFDEVICINGMEHLEKPLDVLAELHRICRAGAIIHIASPHFSSVDYFTDPTHKHPFSSRSFDYLVPGCKLHELQYRKESLRKVKVEITFIELPRIIEEFCHWLANKHTYFYERHLAFIFPAHQIIFDLEVTK